MARTNITRIKGIKGSSLDKVLASRTNSPGAPTCAGWDCYNDAQKFGIVSCILLTLSVLLFIYWFLVIRSRRKTRGDSSEVLLELGFVRPLTGAVITNEARTNQDGFAPVVQIKSMFEDQTTLPPPLQQPLYPKPPTLSCPVQPPPFRTRPTPIPTRLFVMPPPPPPPFIYMAPSVGTRLQDLTQLPAHQPAPSLPEAIISTIETESLELRVMAPSARPPSWSRPDHSYEHPPPGRASTICDSDSWGDSVTSSISDSPSHYNVKRKGLNGADEGRQHQKPSNVLPRAKASREPFGHERDELKWNSYEEVQDKFPRTCDHKRRSQLRSDQDEYHRPGYAQRNRSRRRETSLSPPRQVPTMFTSQQLTVYQGQLKPPWSAAWQTQLEE